MGFLYQASFRRPRLEPRPTQDETHYVRASDGWRLAIHRYRHRGGTGASGEPVLLLHGLGGNATLFDLGVDGVPSLARWLAGQGYDVWAGELRGSGRSARPDHNAPMRWDWNVDDFIEKDVPALVSHVLEHSSFESLHWVGHSLGGILALCHCTVHGSPQVASGTVIAASLDYTNTATNYKYIEPLKGLGRLVKRVPQGQMSTLLAPLGGRFANGIESFNCYPGSTSVEGVRAIYTGTSHDVSGDALWQLSSLFRAGGLRSMDGGTCYKDMIDRVETPMLMISGDRDLQCSPEATYDTYRRLPGGDHKLLHFGRHRGHNRHYGHFDLVAGIHAEDEVYPHLLEWLQAHSPNRPAVHNVRSAC